MVDKKSALKLFSPIALGKNIKLSHRIVMAPMTRSRAYDGECEIHHELGPLYYGQRATEGGLLISEASQISPLGMFVLLKLFGLLIIM